ncbi:MAG TPA: cytochrome C [bacterium]
MRQRPARILRVLALLVAFAALGACAAGKSLQTTHPEKVEGSPRCSECHDDWRNIYDHTPAFARAHGAPASRDRDLCGSCHRASFCADCHAYRDEIAPAEKYADAPERMMPHPRSYVAQHRIDGRLNPAACFRCHGRTSEARCQQCHR